MRLEDLENKIISFKLLGAADRIILAWFGNMDNSRYYINIIYTDNYLNLIGREKFKKTFLNTTQFFKNTFENPKGEMIKRIFEYTWGE